MTKAARNETILLVEDECIVEQVVKNMLVREGYGVMSATDGREGLTLFEQHARELALMIVDIDLPAVSGLELIQRIPTLTPRIPVLFITGLGEYAGLVVEATRQNFPVLHKPFSPAQLLRAIGAATRRSELATGSNASEIA